MSGTVQHRGTELSARNVLPMTLPSASSSAIRPAVMLDLDALVAIDAACFPAGIAYPREEIEFLLRNPQVMTVVAERSGIIVGFAAFQRRQPRRSHPIGRYGELVTIEVLPQFRRQSIGAELYQTLEDSLRDWGGGRMQLHVSIENRAALSFYRRLGYRVIDRAPGYYLKTIDAWQMEKVLASS
ncbi:MAG: N-acetyltransferase [Terriglobia bacterium]|nr:N-acetyltransferase [Terriglobia bacterium]